MTHKNNSSSQTENFFPSVCGEMNEEAIKTFYDLLGHKKQTEIRALKLDEKFKPVRGGTKTFFVSSKEEFVSKVKKLNGEYNLYAGLNERITGGTFAKDVISVKNIFLDIDCKTKPANAEDLQEAERVTDEIILGIENQTGLRATKIYSGNGYQILLCIPEIKITDDNREKIQAQIQQFQRDLIEKYSSDKVKLDNVGDLPRIVRITGTQNIKGGKVSEFVEIHKEENQKMKDYILGLNLSLATSSKIKTKGRDVELNRRFFEVLEKDERIKKLYNGDFEGYDLSIGGELALCCFLIQHDFDKKEIFNIMSSSKIERWAEKGIKYREETYKKALAKISEEKKIDRQEFLIPILNKRTGEVSHYSVDIDKFSEYIISKYFIKTIFGKKSDETFYFDGKIYKSNGRGIIKSEAELILGEYCKKAIADEIFEKIKRRTKTEIEDFQKTDLYKIPLLNGIWNLEKDFLEEHSPENNFRFILPIKYEKESDCPNFKDFLEQILYTEDIDLVQEWTGFLLFRKYFLKKGFIGKGIRDTGKTTLLNIWINFIGEKNKCGIPLQKLTNGNDFAKASLKDKHLNVYDDLSFKDINDEGAFKVATGGGSISAEEKFGDNFEFEPYCKQTFMTNQIPPAKNKEDMAYFSRWLVVEFENQVENQNPFLSEEIKKENSGIFNWALIGLKRLLKNKKFSFDKTPEEVKQIMERSGNPLVSFAEDCLEKNSEEVINRDAMVELYSLWAKEKNRQGKTKRQLGSEIPKTLNWIIDKRDSERTWGQVKIKNEWFIKMSKNEKERKNQKEVSGNQIQLDTLDTFQNNMSSYSKEVNNNNIANNVDIVFPEVSNTSKYTQTPDTSQSEKKAPFLEEELKKIAEEFE